MIHTAVRRKNDGTLADIQSSANRPAAVEARIANAIKQHGGAAADWELVELTGEQMAEITRANKPEPTARDIERARLAALAWSDWKQADKDFLLHELAITLGILRE